MTGCSGMRTGHVGVVAAGLAGLIVLVALAGASAGEGERGEPPATPAASQQVDSGGEEAEAHDGDWPAAPPVVGPAGVAVGRSTALEANRMQMDLRVAELERIVSELARHIGGPTRDLTVRPDTSIDARMDRIEREIRNLESRIARVERQFLNLERTIDRVERRR